MKRLVLRFLISTIGERRTFWLAIRLRLVLLRMGLIRRPPMTTEAESAPVLTFEPETCAREIALARARTLPGHLSVSDLDRLYSLGEGGPHACWVGSRHDSSQALVMLYAGGARQVVADVADLPDGTDLVVLQKDAILPDSFRRAQKEAGLRVVMLGGLSAKDSGLRHLKTQLTNRGRVRVVIVNDVCFQYGAGVATRRQAQSFLLAGWDVAIVCWEPGLDTAYPQISRTVPSGRWLGVRSLRDVHEAAGMSQADIITRVVGEVKGFEPDFVLVGNLHGASWPIDILPALRDEGLPVAAYMHDLHWVTGRCAYTGSCRAYIEGGCHSRCPTAEQYPSLPRNQIASAWRHRADVFTGPGAIPLIANSDWTRDIALSRFGDAACIETVHLGLDHTLFAPIEKQLAKRLMGVPADKPMVLLGSVNVKEERKGGPVLAELLRALNDRDDLGILVFGHGSDMLTSTRAFGLVREEHLMALIYNAADIFIGTAREEAFGQTVVEAAACGLPVVAFKAGGIVEATQEGTSAILQEEFSASAIMAGLDRLLADATLRTEMGAAGRRHVSTMFSLQVQADAWRASLLRVF